MRLILFVDKQTNGASAVPADILQSTPVIQSFNNLVNKDRFHVLMDRIIEMPVKTMTMTRDPITPFAEEFWSPEQVQQGACFKKIEVPIEYSGPTGGISELRSNNISMLCISTNGIADIFVITRVRFRA